MKPAALLGTLALTLLLARSASAVPIIEEPYIEVVKRNPIPGNGALLLSIENVPALQVVVTGPDGERVEGSLEHVRWVYWAFRPSATLAPGEYLIESTDGPPLHARNGMLSEHFDVVEAMDLAPPALSAMPSVSLSMYPEGMQCCEQWTEDSVMQGVCTYVTYKAAQLDPMLSSDAPPEVLDQFLFSTLAQGATVAHEYPQMWGSSFALALGMSDEYCLELEVLSIVDGSAHAYEELDLCVPHGELGSLDPVPSMTPELFYDRARCTVPPADLSAGWCEHNADCADARDDASCIAFNHVCEGGPAPDKPMPVAMPEPTPDAGVVPDAGIIEEPDAETPDVTPPDDDALPARTSSGCGCRTLSASTPRAGVLASCLALVALLARLRRRR